MAASTSAGAADSPASTSAAPSSRASDGSKGSARSTPASLRRIVASRCSITSLRPIARRAEHLFRRDRPAARYLDRLPPLQRSPGGAFGHGQGPCGCDVEAAGSGLLDERVPEARNPVPDGKRDHTVVAPVQAVSRPQLLQVERIGQLPEDPTQPVEEVAEPRWPVDRQG